MTGSLAPSVAGALLREWRARRRLSQLDLANAAETSTRHLSFVETGRSRPSRQLVLRLGQALQMPLAEQNQVLLAAGHAPEFQDARRDATATRYLLEVLDLALAAHDPWPALVIDAHFDVVAMNAAVERLMALVDPELLDPPVNVVRVMLHPRGLADRVLNHGAWRAHLLRQVRRHAAAAPSADLQALLTEVAGYPDRRSAAPAHAGPTFALPLELRVDDAVLRTYSTVATFGTPLDVAASELAIETFLPADETTRRWFAEAAARA
ncbi:MULTISPECIES: helix-turn-helix domain-containing protein [unclassified Modestobacter]|uniref:helix-turn-helix domain-containing protein n=1 Tax=unclassified Modestobacter TaxID=2643866 RepID=UPI0022AABC3E|nr:MULTISPECIES: helix-turn-helix transcriptional regulator [unclassified Modestobacter]MCZ2824726.1 helix-turn-helix transcriptional regulator [Modestobacter sp. VKM Ac-2981]MCZ2854771.1 helix-turn-helix transcriptional regulator [Modestobacter sp. VKM Ac-2982]